MQLQLVQCLVQWYQGRAILTSTQPGKLFKQLTKKTEDKLVSDQQSTHREAPRLIEFETAQHQCKNSIFYDIYVDCALLSPSLQVPDCLVHLSK